MSRRPRPRRAAGSLATNSARRVSRNSVSADGPAPSSRRDASPPMGFIFLSYAREDKKRAREIAKLLRQHSVEVWVDLFRLLPGQRWEPLISSAIADCVGAVFLASRHSLSKETYIQEELDALTGRGAALGEEAPFLLVVRLEDVPIEDPRLRPFHWIDFFEGDEPPPEFLNLIKATWHAEEQAERRADAERAGESGESPGGEPEYVPAKGTTGRVFMPKEVDLYIDKQAKEAYIFHGKEIDYDISHLVYIPEDHSLVVVMKDRTRLDLGVKLQWLLRPHFIKTPHVLIVRTQDGKTVDGRVIPLRLGVAGTSGALALPIGSRLGRFFSALRLFRKR